MLHRKFFIACAVAICGTMSFAANACTAPPVLAPEQEAVKYANESVGFKYHASKAFAIVYGTVEHEIDGDWRKKEKGILKILHVYSGNVKIGDQLLVGYGYSFFPQCPMGTNKLSAGITSVFIINSYPYPYEGLIAEEVSHYWLDVLFKDGVIKSARKFDDDKER